MVQSIFSAVKNVHLYLENYEKVGIRLRNIQSRAKVYKRLLNKPYENEVTLREQNPPLKCCQPLDILTSFEMGIDL